MTYPTLPASAPPEDFSSFAEKFPHNPDDYPAPLVPVVQRVHVRPIPGVRQRRGRPVGLMSADGRESVEVTCDCCPEWVRRYIVWSAAYRTARVHVVAHQMAETLA